MITKRMTWAAFIFAVFVNFITISWAAITIEHSSGSTAVVKNPQRVVVFDLASLDNMVRLGINPTFGVTEGKKPAYLTQFDDPKYEKIGTRTDPNYEKIATFQPDLILIASRVRANYPEFSKLAPTLDMTVGYQTTLKDIERNLNILGEIFDKKREAQAEITNLHKALEEVRKHTKGKGKALIIMTSGGKISAFGPGARFDLLHSAFGIAPVTDKITKERHGQLVSYEFILEHNPDWLLVVDRDAAIGREGQSAAELLDNELIRRTTAGKKGQIIYLDPQSWYLASGNLTGLHNTIKQISEVFQKSR
ncbi:siderophore ABC transporter substrate-binding protein [Bartonella ancashensis]|uniref:Iron compound ABC uptake transporter substrate-binding protein PiuA n=1 Tax=Bartonella ancashensis TaxID=1318743 RepID=A0A0M5KSB6_9HYPH|nr:siderophore ABC transporter substrate-binding protein [Bartonella ancashensis]ALE02940.1 Iron compound ABC uptake transporter substrate-binding protein PiuA [Bartonella ancashensis]